MKRKSGKDYKREYKDLQNKIELLENQIWERLKFLSDRLPSDYEIDVEGIYALQLFDVVEQIDLITKIEKWIGDNNTKYVQGKLEL